MEAKTNEAYISEFFPEVDHGGAPMGPRVLIQLRTVKKKTSGGIILVDETRDFNKGVTTLGKVVAIGPLAFRNRETQALWPEGIWADVGDLVLVRQWDGHRFQRPIPNSDDEAVFVIMEDIQLQYRVRPDSPDLANFFEEIV